MGLIIKESLKKMMKGYPTISDKYDVEGGVNVGATAIKFGELVLFSDEKIAGKYIAFSDAKKTNGVAGICIAENVKLVTTYPGESKDATIEPGEAVTLMSRGFIAVELAAGVTSVAAEDAVYFDAYGKFTNSSSSSTALAGAKFTGAIEGNLAEIRYYI